MKPPGWKQWSNPKYPLLDVDRLLRPRIYPRVGPDAYTIIKRKIANYRNSPNPLDHALAEELQRILDERRNMTFDEVLESIKRLREGQK